MKRILAASLLALTATSTMAAPSTSNFDAPSFGFVQEMAGVTGNGNVSVNLYDGLSSATDIRVGAFGGELMIDSTLDSATSSGIGYKYPITANMAAYGKLYLDTSPAPGNYTNITLGFSYTGAASNLIYNGNAEIFNCNLCSGGAAQTYVYLKAAGYFQTSQKSMSGKVSFGGEINMQMSPSPSTTNVYLGMRWNPKQNVLLDLGIMSSDNNVSEVATPAFMRLTVDF